MGSLRIRERLKELEKTTTHYDQLVEEFIRNDLMLSASVSEGQGDQECDPDGRFSYRYDLSGEKWKQIITKEEFLKTYENTVNMSDMTWQRNHGD